MDHPENSEEYKGLQVNAGVTSQSIVNPYLKRGRFRRHEYSAAEMVEGILKGDVTILSQAVTLVESVNPNLWILMTPILLLQLALLSMGFGIIISSVTTKYRDLAKLVGFGVQLWMYGTPVAYDMFSMAAFAPGGKWHTLYMCNPVTSLINLFRFGYLGFGEVEWKFYWIGWVSTLVILFFGVILFSHVEKTFMDTV